MLAVNAVPPADPGRSADRPAGAPHGGEPGLPVPQVDGVVGLPEDVALAEAARQGVRARVVWRDGTGIPVTMEFVTGRRNLWVRNGIVVTVTVG
ncbi:MAG: hypothetical protein EPO13_03735 [Actinomycetota bacterium]|nr:MAG: hypothetical protein EPO13_03735 [Actinomycetota bacterium]